MPDRDGSFTRHSHLKGKSMRVTQKKTKNKQKKKTVSLSSLNTFILLVFYKHLCHLKWRQALSLSCHGWRDGAQTLIDFHLAGQWLSHLGSQVSFFAAHSIGQHHLMVSELKLLGSSMVGGSLLVTLNAFNILSGCFFFFFPESLESKPIHLIVYFFFKIRNDGLSVYQRWGIPYDTEA